jgi:hypothetical protein
MLLVPIALCVLAFGKYSLHARLRQAPGIMAFVFAVPLFTVYTIYWNGINGAAFYWDSFWAPALMALCLMDASPRQRRFLAYFMLILVLGNVLMGLYESIRQEAFFPVVTVNADGKQVEEVTENFRATAFFPHPLTASLMATMTLLLLYRMQLRFIFLAMSFVLLWVGLLEFGGRTGLGVSLVMTVGAGAWVGVTGMLRRDLKTSTAMYLLLGMIVLPLVLGVIATQTHIAERLLDTMYYDDSAEVRVFQWKVLNYLSLPNWLFGVPQDDLIQLKYQIGIGPNEDIENFWLLLFLNLGAIGFVGFLVFFFTFLVNLARVGSGLFGWLLMIAALIIDSSSNSLGQKTYDLLMEVVILYAMSGFNGWQRSSRRRLRLPPTRRHERDMRLHATGRRAEPTLRQL